MKRLVRQKEYYIDENYLDNIDSEDKAYFLGWMLSDGCVAKNSLRIKLEQSDEYIIKEMFEKFSSGYKMSTDKNSRCISLSSTKLISILKSYGCVDNKTSKRFDLPNVHKNLFRHFVRGYFDGDGSLGIRSARPKQMQVSICSIDENFLKQLKEKLLKYNISSSVYLEDRSGKLLKRPTGEYSSNNANMYRLTLTTHKEKLKFYEFLYDDCTIKLNRKYDKYTSYYLNTKSKLIKDISNAKLIMKLFNKGMCEFQIHKETKIGRKIIKKIISQKL